MAWDEKDWRVEVGKQFVRYAKAKCLHPGDRNGLNKLIYELEADSNVPDDFRIVMRKLTLQSVRGQSNFVTGALNRFWENEIPAIGKAELPEGIPAPPSAAPPVPPAIPPIVAPKIDISKKPEIPRSVWKPKISEYVICLKFDNFYEAAQVRDILTGWFKESFSADQLEIVELLAIGTSKLWFDLLLKTDVLYSALRRKVSQIGWIAECSTKPVSEFGRFTACIE